MSPNPISPPQMMRVAADVARALAEDVGDGDLTAALLPDTPGRAHVISREAGTIAGCDWFAECFRQLDTSVRIDWNVRDGDQTTPDQRLCSLSGPVRALVSGERTALNFLQTLSATATTTAETVRIVADTGARILDTRKTLPGLRHAQKYAVTCGGGHNHRLGLHDAVLIKENHVLACGSIARAVKTAQNLGAGQWIEVEVENLDELQQAIEAGAERVLLDNFSLQQLRSAVRINAGRVRLEASGGIDIDTLRAVAETGVDDISIGSLTKHVKALDLSMRIDA